VALEAIKELKTVSELAQNLQLCAQQPCRAHTTPLRHALRDTAHSQTVWQQKKLELDSYLVYIRIII